MTRMYKIRGFDSLHRKEGEGRRNKGRRGEERSGRKGRNEGKDRVSSIYTLVLDPINVRNRSC